MNYIFNYLGIHYDFNHKFYWDIEESITIALNKDDYQTKCYVFDDMDSLGYFLPGLYGKDLYYIILQAFKRRHEMAD